MSIQDHGVKLTHRYVEHDNRNDPAWYVEHTANDEAFSLDIQQKAEEHTSMVMVTGRKAEQHGA